MPDAEELARLGVQAFDEATPAAAKKQEQAMTAIGTGLAALTSKVVEKMKAGEYVDFADLPPAKGKSRPAPQLLEGQVIVVEAADLIRTRKVIPDLATWAQCFALYVAVVAAHQPARLPDLMAYQAMVAKASVKFKWPSWVVYDQNFRQEAAENPGQLWARVDPSIYAQCFTGQAKTSENWCSECQGLDHTTGSCPYKSRKRTWSTASSTASSSSASTSWGAKGQEVCSKFNRFNGDCRYGRECRFSHVCSRCRGDHPVSKCKMLSGGPRRPAEQ